MCNFWAFWQLHFPFSSCTQLYNFRKNVRYLCDMAVAKLYSELVKVILSLPPSFSNNNRHIPVRGIVSSPFLACFRSSLNWSYFIIVTVNICRLISLFWIHQLNIVLVRLSVLLRFSIERKIVYQHNGMLNHSFKPWFCDKIKQINPLGVLQYRSSSFQLFQLK